MPLKNGDATEVTSDVNDDSVVSAVINGKSVSASLVKHCHATEVYFKSCTVEGGALSCCTLKSCKVKALVNAFDCRFENCEFSGDCCLTRPQLSRCKGTDGENFTVVAD